MSVFFAADLQPREGGAAAANVLDWSSLVQQLDKRPRGEWSVPEAFVAVLFSAVTCDGALASVEHEELLALAHRSRALKSLSVQQLSDLNALVVDRLREEPDALEAACAAIPDEMRSSVFAHALDLVLADGDLNLDEADFLNALILYLKLDRDEVARISDVIVLKNQY